MALAALACCAATGSVAGQETAAAKIDAAKLTNLLRQDCGSCHGLNLRGGLGKPLDPDSLAHWDRAQLTHIILDGVPGTPMPGWRPLLSEGEAVWIADMLKRGAAQ
jgi:cytochrome c55X